MDPTTTSEAEALQSYCCCVKGMKIESDGSKMIKDGTGRKPSNTIKVKVKIEMRPSEKAAPCSVEWFEAGDAAPDRYEKPKGKPDRPAWGEGQWNASHTRTRDGRADQRRFENLQLAYARGVEEYKELLEEYGEAEVEKAGDVEKPDPWVTGADDSPYGGVERDLDVLVIAKSGCPGCVSCCAWLRYSYGAKAIDVTVLGASCGTKCDGIAGDYKAYTPFRDQLPKPPARGARLSSGTTGSSYEVPFQD